MLNIAVCMKQVPDPEVPASLYKIDKQGDRVIHKGVPPVLSPFDENALEMALGLKDAHKGKVNVISMGAVLSRAVLRRSLAAGADKLILLEDQSFANMDSYNTAFLLAAAIRKMGEVDLVLTGIQAADTNAGIVGAGIGEILGIPCVSECHKIEVSNRLARLERVTVEGYEVLEAPLPVLVTVSSDAGELRPIGLQALMESKKKPTDVWDAEELGAELFTTRKTGLLNMFIPERNIQCKIIDGENEEELAMNLAYSLRKAEVI